MRSRQHLRLLGTVLVLSLGAWPGVGRTHRKLELDPPKRQAAQMRARGELVMRPSRMDRKNLELYFGLDQKDSASLKQRRDALRNRLAVPVARSQRAALAAAQASGRTADGAKPSVSNPVMTAFADLVAQLEREQPQAFAGVHVIALQHLLGTTGGLLRSVARLGAKPGEVYALGKKYSQHEQVMDELAQAGFRVRPARHESEIDVEVGVDSYGSHGGDTLWGSHAQFELAHESTRPVRDRKAELDERIAELVQSLAKQPKRGRVLVVDDGGDLIERIHSQHPELHDRIVAVEQTRRGIRKLEGLDLGFPVIDVAQAEAKLKYESPMIGRSIAKTTIARLLRIEEAGQVLPRRILSIGHGAVGAAANRALRRAGFEVQVYDRSPAIRRQAKRAGYRVYEHPDEALRHGDIVLSMTGETVLDGAALAKLPEGAVLINGASSSTELLPDKMDLMRGLVMNSVEIGEHSADAYAYYRGVRFKMGTLAKRDLHADRPTKGMDWPVAVRSAEAPHDRKADKKLLWVNQGEVVNFDGSVDPIPARYIQLTRGLLLLGAAQAMKTDTPGIHALDAAQQARWVAAVNADLVHSGESLERPTF